MEQHLDEQQEQALQQDYRSSPSLGGRDLEGNKVGDYDQPFDAGSLITKPYPDNSMKSYDLPVDALHSSGLHDPTRAVALKQVPPADAVGWSADPSAISWERQGGDGSPPGQVSPW